MLHHIQEAVYGQGARHVYACGLISARVVTQVQHMRAFNICRLLCPTDRAEDVRNRLRNRHGADAPFSKSHQPSLQVRLLWTVSGSLFADLRCELITPCSVSSTSEHHDQTSNFLPHCSAKPSWGLHLHELSHCQISPGSSQQEACRG